jgi:DNA topoisomerase VI subunit B
MTVTSSSQWISSNLSLAGFDEENTPFMIVKELLDNALDACCGRSVQQVEVHFEQHPDYIEISCSDNGIGFNSESIESIHTVFQSSRFLTGDSCTGKFGIGLKAVAFVSYSGCSKHLHISSRRASSSTCISFYLVCDDSGDITIRDVSVAEHCENEEATTTVTAYTRHTQNFEQYLVKVHKYVSESVRLRPNCSISCSVNDEDPEIFLPANIPRSITHSDPSGMLQANASIVSTPKNRPTISIIRYVNGTPLTTRNCMNCVLSSCCQSGIGKMCASMGIEMASAFSPSDIVTISAGVSNTPHGSSWTGVVIRLNLVHPTRCVDYTCLSKDGVCGIQSTASSLTSIVTRCLRSTLKKLQTKHPTQFQSNEQYERHRALSVYIPSIAFNLAQLVVRIRERNCEASAKLFDLFSEGERETVEEKLKRLLTDSINRV